jgi:hypothetical protein
MKEWCFLCKKGVTSFNETPDLKIMSLISGEQMKNQLAGQEVCAAQDSMRSHMFGCVQLQWHRCQSKQIYHPVLESTYRMQINLDP